MACGAFCDVMCFAVLCSTFHEMFQKGTSKIPLGSIVTFGSPRVWQQSATPVVAGSWFTPSLYLRKMANDAQGDPAAMGCAMNALAAHFQRRPGLRWCFACLHPETLKGVLLHVIQNDDMMPQFPPNGLMPVGGHARLKQGSSCMVLSSCAQECVTKSLLLTVPG